MKIQQVSCKGFLFEKYAKVTCLRVEIFLKSPYLDNRFQQIANLKFFYLLHIAKFGYFLLR
jgi:hypothetical protein